jgi:hypothetical protein
MTNFIHGALEFIGLATVATFIFIVLRVLWEAKDRFFHKHSYQVGIVRSTQVDGREHWTVYLKCELCGKEKRIAFYNDKLRLYTRDVMEDKR